MDIGCGEGTRSHDSRGPACKRERLGRWCSCLEAAGSRGAKNGAKPPIRLLQQVQLGGSSPGDRRKHIGVSRNSA